MTEVSTNIDYTSLRRRLVENLVADGAIASVQWRETFTAVERHMFAKAFRHRYAAPGTGDDDGLEFLTGRDEANRARWAEVVYSDDSLVTHYTAAGSATSSSTQPSLMAIMLERLDVRDGMRVLEIGTGTGYNAALLSHRLGSENVTTVEIDPVVADEARASLREAGFAPTVITGDGLTGHEPAAPYDRIIATCSTNRVPAAWLAQTKPGGIIVANVGLGVVPLTVSDDGASASGQFLPGFAGFIEARPADGHQALTHLDVLAMAKGEPDHTRTSEVNRDYEDVEFVVFLRICLPGISRVVIANDNDDRTYLFADAATRSWATASTTGTIKQTGERRLYNEIETIHNRWTTAGKPHHSHLELTVKQDSSHLLRVVGCRDEWFLAP